MLQPVTTGTSPPRVILAGEETAQRRFEDALGRLDVQLARTGSEDELAHEVGKGDVALVLIHAGTDGDGAMKTIQRLRARGSECNTPLLMVSHAVPSVLADFDDPCLGLFDILIEPVPPGLLRAKVRLLLDVVAIRRATRLCADVAAQLGTRPRAAPDRDVLVHLDGAVRDTIARVQPAIPSGVSLETALGSRNVQIPFDRENLERVLLGLIHNALEAMPCGGTLRVATGTDAAQAGARRGVCITVSDTGNGIDAAAREHLFEPGYTTKLPARGRGLSLDWIRRIVEDRGGVLQIHSVPGRGTEAALHLWYGEARTAPPSEPASERAPAPMPESPVEAPPANRPPGVLVVEDDEALRTMVRAMLEANGYAVHCASSAEEGQRSLEKHRAEIDLVLTDIVLPGVSGIVFGHRLRANEPALKVCYMTAHPDILDGRRASVAEYLEHLRKPFSVDELVAFVRHSLDGPEVRGLPPAACR